jgi:hypothetical protein
MASRIMPTPEVLNKTAILKTYRQLLRATYIAFKGKSNALRSIITFAGN